MGLDIFHHKMVLVKPKITPFSANYMTCKEYAGFDVEIDYFSAYLQKIDVPVVQKTLILPKQEKKVAEIRKRFEEYKILFHSDENELKSQIQDFEAKNTLLQMEKHEWETSDWKGIDYFDFVQEEGFYFEEVGYQRKGMNDAFFDRFYKDRNINAFTKKSDFEFALKCVDFYWDSDTQEDVQLRYKSFKKNFVEKYEENRSWMDLSY